jgi:hypothetical protein
MEKLDQMIDEALSSEDRSLMAEVPEPGFFGQFFGQFRGPDAWVNWLTSIALLVFAVLAVTSAYRFFFATEIVDVVRHGILAAVSIVIIGMFKLYFLNEMQAARVIRAVKRLELIIATRG